MATLGGAALRSLAIDHTYTHSLSTGLSSPLLGLCSIESLPWFGTRVGRKQKACDLPREGRAASLDGRAGSTRKHDANNGGARPGSGGSWIKSIEAELSERYRRLAGATSVLPFFFWLRNVGARDT